METGDWYLTVVDHTKNPVGFRELPERYPDLETANSHAPAVYVRESLKAQLASRGSVLSEQG